MFLLVRSADHVVLGLSWEGFAVTPGAAPALRVTGAHGTIVVTFPPQHVAERVADADPPPGYGLQEHMNSRIAGPSHVAFIVPSSTTVVLTAEGVLRALLAGRVVTGSSAIEVVWRLVVAAESRSGGDVVGWHAVAPVTIPLGVTGLWEMSLRAADGLVIRPIDRPTADTADPEPFAVPLSRFDRTQIFDYGSREPPPVSRLDLSALGASLTARADWRTFSWEHRSRLGRDHYLRVAAQGVCLPFGHRAQYVEITERAYLPWWIPIQGLRKTRTVVIIERVRLEAAGDPALSRAFPFGEVEILDTAVEVVDPVPIQFQRPAPDRARLEDLRDQYQAQLDEATLVALAARYGPGTTPADLAPASVDEALRWDPYGPDGQELPEPPEIAAYWALKEQLGYVGDLLRSGHEPLELCFWPTGPDGKHHRFKVRLAGTLGDVHIALPLLFVFDRTITDPYGVVPDFHTLTDPAAMARLDELYSSERAGQVSTDGATIDLVRLPPDKRVDPDLQEVHKLNIVAVAHEGGFRPRLGPPPGGSSRAEPWGFAAGLPAVRALVGGPPSTPRLRFADEYERTGPGATVVYEVHDADKVGIDFVGRSNRSGGLIAPQLTVDGVSRLHGLVQSAALLTPTLDPAKALGDGSTLLGFRLTELIRPTADLVPPAITSSLLGAVPQVQLAWTGIALDSSPPFISRDATLDLTVVSSGGEATTTCTVRNFTLQMPPGDTKLLEVSFGTVEFTQKPGQPPSLTVGQVEAAFFGPLKLVDELRKAVDLAGAAVRVQVDNTRVVAQYSLAVPSASCGVFVLRGIAFTAAVEVPFTGAPVSVTLGFASRANPFNLSVLMFGGGGYLEVEVDYRGLRRLEASLEFGASVAVDFLVASGEVHALGGIRYVMQDGQVQLSGYLRFGGSVDVLGLISVAIEMQVTLTYDLDHNRMVGRATLVIDIDLLIYSDSVELDSGEWVLIGGSAPAMAQFALIEQEPPMAVWRHYLERFRE